MLCFVSILIGIVLQGLSSLPKFICYPCLDQLKITYNFQLKIQHLIDDNRKPSDEIDGSTPLQSDDDNLNDTRPFACNLCGRRFKVKEHYETHCKRHLEKGQQFRCLTCGLCFLLKQHLTQHKCPK